MSGLDITTATMAYQAQSPGQALPKGASLREMNKLAQDFEAFFLSQALQPMFADIEPEGPFGGGPGNDIWKSMQVDEYGKALAKSGGIGIADAVMKQMLIAQEGMN
jgi:peptidoglycan hydrolase FlgJ